MSVFSIVKKPVSFVGNKFKKLGKAIEGVFYKELGKIAWRIAKKKVKGVFGFGKNEDEHEEIEPGYKTDPRRKGRTDHGTK